jgi:hypothetical protein
MVKGEILDLLDLLDPRVFEEWMDLQQIQVLLGQLVESDLLVLKEDQVILELRVQMEKQAQQV